MTAVAFRLICIVLFVGLGAGSLFAQAIPPASPEIAEKVKQFQARIDQTANALAKDRRFKRFSQAERQLLVEFVTGNMLFVATHELGHAVISELQLPVLGREEDAADDFATLTALKVVGTDFSERVLVQSAWGWFLAAQRDKRNGDDPNFYDRHGMSEQRAYQIVCLMVGSDASKFKDLAEKTGLPEDRRRSCGWDYETATRSWDSVITPHRRAENQAKATIGIKYGDANGDLADFARAFREIKFLEVLAGFAADRFVWPQPIVMEMQSCGESNARWTIESRTLLICYEMAKEFAELYKNYGRMMAKKLPGARNLRPSAAARSLGATARFKSAKRKPASAKALDRPRSASADRR